jgi:plasmid maintenance system antidote protein VapI
MRTLKPVTPGELLLEEFLKPMQISHAERALSSELAKIKPRDGMPLDRRRALTHA